MSPQTERILKCQNISNSFRLSESGEEILNMKEISIMYVIHTVPLIINSIVCWSEHHVLRFFILI